MHVVVILALQSQTGHARWIHIVHKHKYNANLIRSGYICKSLTFFSCRSHSPHRKHTHCCKYMSCRRVSQTSAQQPLDCSLRHFKSRPLQWSGAQEILSREAVSYVFSLMVLPIPRPCTRYRKVCVACPALGIGVGK